MGKVHPWKTSAFETGCPGEMSPFSKPRCHSCKRKVEVLKQREVRIMKDLAESKLAIMSQLLKKDQLRMVLQPSCSTFCEHTSK